MMKDNQSQIVLPDAFNSIPLFNLEARLRAMGDQDNSYVIGIFDCCREAFDEKMFPKVTTPGSEGNENNEVFVEKG